MRAIVNTRPGRLRLEERPLPRSGKGEVRVRTHACGSAGAWAEAVRLAVDGEVPFSRLITHHLPADRFLEGVALVQSRRDDVIKVALEWSPSDTAKGG